MEHGLHHYDSEPIWARLGQFVRNTMHYIVQEAIWKDHQQKKQQNNNMYHAENPQAMLIPHIAQIAIEACFLLWRKETDCWYLIN